MFRARSLVVACFAFILSAPLFAGDLRIPLPKRSKYTPVQALNRDGVKAVEHHQYDKAKKLFYKAYLIDPNDPFTLNNLGYMAELDGDADRARRFYALAADLGSDAIIDKANNDVMIGKAVSAVAGRAEDKGIKINRLNNQAIALLEKGRAPEADLVLQKALTVDATNPFTLNNLGYAKEKEGELEAAYQFYTAAANVDSQEKVEVALDKDWRGRAISDVARDNAHKLNKRLRDINDTESRVALLNLRGVSAINRNDRRAGREFIEKAFKLDPADAFTLNNMGYLAEMDGDKETADFYYERAREANENNARIAVATNKVVEGKRIGDVADVTDQLVQQQMEAEREARRRQGGPVLLMHRNDQPVVEPAKPVHEPKRERVSNDNGELLLPPLPPPVGTSTPSETQPVTQPGGLVQPLPDNEQPTTIKEGPNNGGLLMPLPDTEQPPAAQPNGAQPQPKQGDTDHGLIMPLPDDQQPGAKPNSAQPQPKQGPDNGGLLMPLPDNEQPPAANSGNAQPQPKQGPNDGGLLMPLPDDQQPGAKPNSAQPQPKQGPSNGGLLMPLPDKEQPPAARTNPQPTQPEAPVVPQTSPTTSQPQSIAAPPQQSPQPQLLLPPPDKQQPPKHISDEDQPKQKKKSQQNGDGVKKITDQ